MTNYAQELFQLEGLLQLRQQRVFACRGEGACFVVRKREFPQVLLDLVGCFVEVVVA